MNIVMYGDSSVVVYHLNLKLTGNVELLTVQIKKSNLRYSCVITSKLVARPISAPSQYSFEETSQQWLAVGDTVFDLTNQGIEPRTFRTNSEV